MAEGPAKATKADRLPSFNLLPWRGRQARARRRAALSALSGAVAAALALVFAADLYLRLQLHEQQQRNSEIRALVSRHQQAGANLEALQARNARLSLLIGEVERIQRRNKGVREWLGELPDAVPGGLLLTRLRLSGEGWELQGAAADMEKAAVLLERLRAMPAVENARLDEMQSDQDRSRQFLLVGKLRK